MDDKKYEVADAEILIKKDSSTKTAVNTFNFSKVLEKASIQMKEDIIAQLRASGGESE